MEYPLQSSLKVPFSCLPITAEGFPLATVSTTQIENVPKTQGAWVLGCFVAMFGSVFTLAGLVIVATAGVWPLVLWYQSLQWVEAPCTIEAASIETHHDSDGNTYYPEIRYTYQWKGDFYPGTRFAWDSTSYGSRASIEKWMEPYPVGKQTVCYVDPRNPKDAVLTRAFPKIVLVFIPFGLLFVVVGLAVAVGVPRMIRSQQAKMRQLTVSPASSSMRSLSSSAQSTTVTSQPKPFQQGLPISAAVPHEAGESNEPLVIQPKMGRVGSLIAILFICCFWNGIVSVFLFSMFGGKGGPPIFMLLFLTPFILVGLGFVAAAVYTLLGLFNPKPVLVCSDRWLYAGSEFELSWMMKGNVSRIQKLTVFLEGTETVHYRQGTSTRTESNVFYSHAIAELTDSDSITQSYHIVKIPDDAMHTFDAASNKIQWQVRFAGEIPRWPDVADVFEITILPPLPYGKDV